jgi:uncharacterized membrane protein
MWEFMFFIFGLILGVVSLLLYQAVRRGLAITWYEWLMGVIGTILLYFGVWHFFGSLRELETQGGWLGLAILAIPGIILIIVAYQLWRRQQVAS